MYLAFDLGASSGRAIVGRLEGEVMHMEEVHRFPTPLREADGHLYWDLQALGREMDAGLARARAAAPDLRSLSIDSWGVDYVPLDGAGRPLRDAFCYRDPRVVGRMAEAHARVSAAEIYAATGIQFMEINTVYQVLADRAEEPDLFRRTANRLMIADYLAARWSGRAVAEVSLASTTQLMDPHRRRWAADLMRRFDIPAEGWPEIVPAGTRLGEAGGAPGVEVVAGCSHDTACAVAAVPAEAGRRWAYVSLGTWSLLGVELEAPVLTAAARRAGFTNEAGLDGTIRFLKNLTGLWVLQECEREWQEAGASYTYDDLLREAAEAPSAGAFLDLNDPRFGLRGDMQQKLRDYCREHGLPVPQRRGELVRAVLESMAEAHRRALRLLEEVLGEPIEVLHIVGGGSRNRLLCQWTADACGLPVVAGPVEATALGNLLIQARAMGDLPAGCSVRDVVRASCALATYEPQKNEVFQVQRF